MRIHGPGLDSVIGIDSLIPPESESTYLIGIFDVKLDNIATGYDIKNRDLYCGSGGGIWITYIQNVSSISINRIRESVSFRYNLIDPKRKQGGFYEYFFNVLH